MSVTTRAELVAELAQVNAAILKAVQAEGYAAGDLSVTRSIAELRRQRTVLEREIRAIDAVNAGGEDGGVSTATFS